MNKQLWFGVVIVAVLLAALAAVPVYGGNHEGQGRSSDVVPDSYIVVLQDGVSPGDVASAHGVARKHVYKSVFNGFSGHFGPILRIF